MDTTNADDLEWEETQRGDVEFRRKRLAEDGRAIGSSLYEVPPGKRSWPYHYHTANEEALFVLAGEGYLRTADGDLPLETGDFVSIPAGEAGAHQVVNDGEVPLRYLLHSTMIDPDVTVYPDTETFGVFVGAAPGGRGDRDLHGFYRIDGRTSYWDEE
ncbi:cupin domain-containing protein [Natronobiforma cellulositropha]|uniref:cupin domain-containing protein n=1 Tax=Natronobiforma cellulositropha TaxID=1679076 RepID=UPI0021D59304|nr:cupin domain-containing protein [Natronobiforma cellulositropha]